MKANNKKGIIICAAIVVALAMAAALSLIVLHDGGTVDPGGSAGQDGKTAQKIGETQAGKRKWSRADVRKALNARRGIDDDDDDEDAIDVDELPPEDRAIMNAIETAMEMDDYALLAREAVAVAASTNVEVRGEYVQALGWFGKKAMLELLPFMADPDEDVAEDARDSWTMGLGEISNQQLKVSYIESASKVLNDTDVLDEMMTELIDCDEAVAIQTLVNIIEGEGTAGAKATARDNYEFITGEEYEGIEAAENWLKENAEESEDADGGDAAAQAETEDGDGE